MVDIADFRFRDPSASFREGYDQVNALKTDQARVTAGNALQAGNYADASGALYGTGDLSGGLQVQKIAQAKQDAADKAASDQKAGLLKFTQDTATRLSQFHQSQANQPGADPNAVTQRTLAAFDQLAPRFKEMGESDDDIAQVRAHIAQDPQATFAALGAAASKELGYDVKVVDGQIVAVDKSTGKARLIAQAGGAQAAPQPGQPGAAPTSGPVDTDALWKAIKQQESGGEASPGTAVGPDTPYGNALGSTQMLPATAEAMARKLGIPWNPALMRENSPKALAYQDQLGRAYLQEGLDRNGGDPAAAAAYYFGGPNPALHGPKTAKYVQDVLARANPQPYEVASNGPTPLPPSAPAPAPGTVDANGVLTLAPHQPDWTPDGKGALINRKTGDRKKDPSFEDTGGGSVDQNIVNMVLDGRYPVPTGRAATSPKWQAVVEAAAAQDPGFDAANYATRVKTRQSFLSGRDAQNITAINTLVGHLDALDHSVDRLGNFGGFLGSHALNAGKEWLQEQSGNAQAYKDFEANKEAVVTEATRVFRGASGAEADVKRNLDMLNNANSPAELHQAVQTIAHLMGSRLDAVADTYNQGMGKSKDPMEFLHPEQARAFARMAGNRSVPDNMAAPARSSAPPGGGRVIRYDAQGNRVQ